VSEVFDAGRRPHDPGSQMGLTSLCASGADGLGDGATRFISDRVRQHRRNAASVPASQGRDQRRPAAPHHDVTVRGADDQSTGSQRIDLLGIAKEDLPGVWRDLGMRSGAAAIVPHGDRAWLNFCRFGLGDAIALGIEMEERFKGIRAPARVNSPWPAAAQLLEALVGRRAVAVEGGRTEIRIGGAAGADPRATCSAVSRARCCWPGAYAVLPRGRAGWADLRLRPRGARPHPRGRGR
jgi:nitrite reductase (NADH) large subunit